MLRALTVFLFVVAAAAQPADQAKAELQQRIAAIRQSIARNQQQLRQYSWTETIQMILKGEEKKREQNECRYGPDGKVVKNPIGTPPAPSGKKGLKGKIVKNKIEDLKEYMDRVKRLDDVYKLVNRVSKPDQENQAPDLMELGKACEAAGLRDEARGWYTLAISRDPLDAKAQRALGQLRESDAVAAPLAR